MSTQTILDTFSAIEQRRSIKEYDPNHKMTEADIQKLMSLTLLSPTSFNIQNWRFVVVEDMAVKEQLFAAAWKQKQVVDSSITILLCADLKSWNRQPERYWKNAPENVAQMLVGMIQQFYANNEALNRDEAMRSIGIASQTIMLAAKAMGLDTCPMVGFDPVKVAEIIRLPQDYIIGLMITVGKAAKPARERGGQLDYSEVVFKNSF